MRLFNRSLAWTTGLAALIAASAALAGGFGVREQSATAQGFSFAGAASGSGGLSSMFWNPAVVTMKPGWNSEYHASIIFPQADVTALPGTAPFLLPLGSAGDIGRDALVPASYSSYQLNDRIWLGLSSNSPFGLVTKPNPVWAGQNYARTSRIFSLNVNPVVGVKITDWLSVAAGPSLQYFDVNLKQAVPVAPALAAFAPTAILKGDDVGIGFTAGALLTPWAGTQIGVGYRSMINHDIRGSLTTPAAVTRIRTSLNTPETVTVGLTQWITPTFNVNLGFEWTNWSRIKTLNIVAVATGASATNLNLQWRDGFMYSVGAEYWLAPQWAVRAGLAYEESPITERVRTPRLPDNDRIWASIGATYKWNEWLSFDLAYTHIFVRNTRINLTPGNPSYTPPLALVANVDASVDIVSAAVKIRWDTPAPVAVPTAPIVRKY